MVVEDDGYKVSPGFPFTSLPVVLRFLLLNGNVGAPLGLNHGPLAFSLYCPSNINASFRLMSSNLLQPSLLGYRFTYPTTF